MTVAGPGSMIRWPLRMAALALFLATPTLVLPQCVQAPLTDGWGGSPPTGMSPPHCDAADAWTVVDGHRVRLPCEHWLSPAARAREAACTPCSTAAPAGAVAGTGGPPIDNLRAVTRRDLAEAYCGIEDAYKQNLQVVDEQIEKGLGGVFDFRGGPDPRALEQKTLAPATVPEAVALRARRATGIEKLGRSSRRVRTALAAEQAGHLAPSVSTADRDTARAASVSELREASRQGEDRSSLRREAPRYDPGDHLEGDALERALSPRRQEPAGSLSDRDAHSIRSRAAAAENNAIPADQPDATARGLRKARARGSPQRPAGADLPDPRLLDRLWKTRK